MISKILSDPKVDKTTAILSIFKAFESNEKLKPVSCIAGILNIQETEKFLVKERLGVKIKNVGTYVVASIIPAVISVMQLLFLKP